MGRVVLLGGPAGDVPIAQLRNVVQPAYRQSLGADRWDSLSGQQVTRDDAMGIPPFLAGVLLLAMTAGTLPLEVRDEANDNATVKRAGIAMRLGMTPNAETPASVFWTTMFMHLIPMRNAFILKLPATDGIQAPELYLLEPELVQKYRGPDREIRYDIYTREGGEFATAVHGRHIIHLRGPAVHSTFRPESLISLQRNTLGNALATQEYQGALYRNGGIPRGLLTTDEVLTVDQGLEMADAWRAAYGGSENAGKIAVLDRGGSYQSVAMTNEHAQFSEQLQMSATDAARILLLPPSFIGAEGSSMTYDNASSNRSHLLTFALRPWLDLVEGALNMDVDLFGVGSAWVPRYNTDEIGRPDQGERYDNYSKAVPLWMDANEARTAEGLPKRPDAPAAPPAPAASAPPTDPSDSSTETDTAAPAAAATEGQNDA